MREAALSTGQGQGSATTLQGRPDAIDTSQLSKGVENVRQSFREDLKAKALEAEKARQQKQEILNKVSQQKAATKYGQDRIDVELDALVEEAEKLTPTEFNKKYFETQRKINEVILKENTIIKLAEDADKAGKVVYDPETGISIPTTEYTIMKLSGEFTGEDPLELAGRFEDKIAFDSKLESQAGTLAQNWVASKGIESVDIKTDDSGKLIVTDLETLSEKDANELLGILENTLAPNAAATLEQAFKIDGKNISAFQAQFLTDFEVTSPITGQKKTYANFNEWKKEYVSNRVPQTQKQSVTSKPSEGSGRTTPKDVETVIQKRPMATESGTYGEKEVMTANIRATSTTTADGKKGKARSVYVDEGGNRMVNITVNKPNGKQEIIPTPYNDVSGDLTEVEAAFEALEKIPADERVKIIGLSEEEAANIDADLIDLDKGYQDDPEKIKSFEEKYLKGTGIKAKEPTGRNPSDITLVFPDGEEKSFNTNNEEKRLEIIKAINEAKKGGNKEETKEESSKGAMSKF